MIKTIWRVLYLFLIAKNATICVYAEISLKSLVPPELIFETLALNRDIATPASPQYRSPSALAPSPDGRFLYVAEQTAKRISVVDIKSKKVCKSIRMPNEVTGIAVAPGGLIYATCSSDLWPQGMVCEINAVSEKILRRLPGGFGARSPIISPDGKLLYICNQYGNDVQFIDITRGIVLKKLSDFHQPFSSSITPDGSVLVVADCLPSVNATDEQNVAARISIVNTFENRIDTVISLPMGSHSVFDVTISPDGAFAFVSHLVALFTLQTNQIEGGWIHTNNCAVIDIRNRKLLNDFTLDDPHSGAANPWELCCTDDGTLLCVTHAGSNELSVIDLRKMLQIAAGKSTIVTYEKGLKFTGCSHDLQALTAVKYRVPVTGKGPRALAITGKRAFTAGYFGDSTGQDYIEMFDLAPGNNGTKPAGKISLGQRKPLTNARKGEQAFYDATQCHQKWQSCSSCHPSARADGLNWILGPDPTNTQKNAKSMVYSWWTPPTQWSGKRAGAGVSVRLGFKNSLFSVVDYSISANIDTFLMQIRPVKSPYLIKGMLSSAAVKGKHVYFNNSTCDCITCHKGPLYTDMNLHPSSIPLIWDKSTKWDTPALVETWRDVPYGHLGSFEHIEDIMKYGGHSTSIVQGLSEEEFRNLVQYVLSL